MSSANWRVVLLGAIVVGVSGCSGSSQESPDEGTVEGTAMGQMAPAAAAEDESMEVEVGCAMCMYEMEGIETCVTAAKVGEQVYLVSGGGLDAHTSGLCSATKQATLVGHIDGERLAATSITVH